VIWFGLAAKQGHAFAQCNLGLAYGKGVGVPEDYTEAVIWFGQAATQNVANAQFNMGVAYYNGRGVPKNSVQAYAWFSLAAGQKHEESNEALSVLLKEMTPSQIEEGHRLSREYAEKLVKKE